MRPDRERFARYTAAYRERFGVEPTETPDYVSPTLTRHS